MHVDRSRFLLFTASIASGSCSSTPPPADDVAVAEPMITIEPAGTEPLVVEREPVMGEGSREATDSWSARCEQLKAPPGPHCESFEDTVDDCKRYAAVLTPAAADRASSCLVERSGSQAICKFGVSGACFLTAAQRVPRSGEAQSPCRTAMSRCTAYREPDLTLDNCSAAFSAVETGQRDRLLTCIAESCSVKTCFWSLDRR